MLPTPVILQYDTAVFRLPRFSVTILAFMAVSTWHYCLGQQAHTPALTTLKTFRLRGKINSADISPDETLVALERTSEDKTENIKVTRFSEIVEVWDFRADKLVGRVTLRKDDVQQSTRGRSIDPVTGARFVRFTGDGRFLAAYIEHSIRMLSADDLSEIESIPAEGPPSTSRTYHVRKIGPQTITDRPAVQAFEMSPTGRLLAMLWVRDLLYGRIDIYDISSGQQVATWGTPQGWVSSDRDRGLTWSSASQTVFLAVPNSIPCLAPGGSPDVFGFDALSGRTKTAVATGLLVGDIAVTPTEHLLAVDSNCVGVLKNHHPKLKVFDLRTNKHAGDVRAEKSGVRYRVSVSRNGQRAAAWTSDVKCKFDWGDMDCFDWTVSPMFTVWHLPEFSVVARSQTVSAGGVLGTRGALRISSTGHYLLMYGTMGFVFELP